MYLILLSIFVPMAAGLCLLILPEKNIVRARLLSAVSMAYLLTAVLITAALTRCYDVSYTLFHLTASLPVCFHIDETGVLFAALTLIVLLCAGFFSFAYMKHEKKEKRYYGFYLIVFGVLNALCFAGNLITFYLFFEILTLTSMPLVLHNGSPESHYGRAEIPVLFPVRGLYGTVRHLFYLEKQQYAGLHGRRRAAHDNRWKHQRTE